MTPYGVMEAWRYACTHQYVWHSPSASGLTHHYNYIPYTHRTPRMHKFALKCKISQLSKPQLATLAVGMAFRLQRFSAAQVCQIITGDDGEVDYIFPGSDDELTP